MFVEQSGKNSAYLYVVLLKIPKKFDRCAMNIILEEILLDVRIGTLKHEASTSRPPSVSFLFCASGKGISQLSKLR